MKKESRKFKGEKPADNVTPTRFGEGKKRTAWYGSTARGVGGVRERTRKKDIRKPFTPEVGGGHPTRQPFKKTKEGESSSSPESNSRTTSRFPWATNS